jgi:hypothetical protein
MFQKYFIGVKPLYLFSISHIYIVEVIHKLINFVYILEYEVSNFPWQGDELIFPFFMEKGLPKIVLPCQFHNKQFIRYMVQKKRGIFLGTKDPDDTVIFHMFYHSIFIQEFISLVIYPGGIFTKQQSFENLNEIIVNLIKNVEKSCVSTMLDTRR